MVRWVDKKTARKDQYLEEDNFISHLKKHLKVHPDLLRIKLPSWMIILGWASKTSKLSWTITLPAYGKDRTMMMAMMMTMMVAMMMTIDNIYIRYDNIEEAVKIYFSSFMKSLKMLLYF